MVAVRIVLVVVLGSEIEEAIVQHQMDHEKLDVYQIEVQFVGWSTDLMVELFDSPEAKTRRIAGACDHLDREGRPHPIRDRGRRRGRRTRTRKNQGQGAWQQTGRTASKIGTRTKGICNTSGIHAHASAGGPRPPGEGCATQAPAGLARARRARATSEYSMIKFGDRKHWRSPSCLSRIHSTERLSRIAAAGTVAHSDRTRYRPPAQGRGIGPDLPCQHRQPENPPGLPR